MSIESNDRRWSTSQARLQKRIDHLIKQRADELRDAESEKTTAKKKKRWAYAHTIELKIETLCRRLRKLQAQEFAKKQPALFEKTLQR